MSVLLIPQVFDKLGELIFVLFKTSLNRAQRSFSSLGFILFVNSFPLVKSMFNHYTSYEFFFSLSPVSILIMLVFMNTTSLWNTFPAITFTHFFTLVFFHVWIWLALYVTLWIWRIYQHLLFIRARINILKPWLWNYHSFFFMSIYKSMMH